MSPALEKTDRPALIRRALVELVADNGFRGSSMSAIAERAGVATGTAYVHYASKDELLMAAYLEIKVELSEVALGAIDSSTSPADRFSDLWRAIYDHLASDPVLARFMLQVEVSPLAANAHEVATVDTLLLQSPVMQEVIASLVPLPVTVLWDLGLGPAVRLAASPEPPLSAAQLQIVAAGCWRAVTAA